MSSYTITVFGRLKRQLLFLMTNQQPQYIHLGIPDQLSARSSTTGNPSICRDSHWMFHIRNGCWELFITIPTQTRCGFFIMNITTTTTINIICFAYCCIESAKNSTSHNKYSKIFVKWMNEWTMWKFETENREICSFYKMCSHDNMQWFTRQVRLTNENHLPLIFMEVINTD